MTMMMTIYFRDKSAVLIACGLTARSCHSWWEWSKSSWTNPWLLNRSYCGR